MKNVFAFLSKIISKIHMPFNHKRISEEQCLQFLSLLEDGDVVLSHTSGELSNFFLAHYGHAAIYYKGKMYEAITSGVKKTDPMFFFARKDDITILKPMFSIDFELLYNYLEKKIGIPYDFMFNEGADHLYCFEYVACALMNASAIKIDKVKTPIGEEYLAESFDNSDFKWRAFAFELL